MENDKEEKRHFADTTVDKRDWYTQREWDRVVGYGKIPEEYSVSILSHSTFASKNT